MQHGVSHVHSYALDMAWYEYLMLDVLATCVLIPLVLVTSAVTACFCCCLHRKSAVTTKHDKQQ